MKVVFLGNDAWSVPSLEALAASPHRPALVATRVPRPGGRGNRLLPTPVSEAARRLGLPLREVETVRAGPGFEALAEAGPEALVVVAYGEILPDAVLALPSLAPVNVHFSLLPQLRGAAPVQRAIMSGLAVTGVTTMRIDAGLDTGPVLLQAEEPIRPEDDAGSLGQRLAALGARLLVETLDRLEAGTLQEGEQDHRAATFAPKLKPEERPVDWAKDAASIVRQVRALAPEPAATTIFRGRGLKILAAAPGGGERDPGTPPPPGTILPRKHGLDVVSGDGLVELVQVAPEGRNRMTGGEFVHGYRPVPGERLG